MFVWKQIIDYANQNHKDVIFVTFDQKEDWWNRARGKILGPRIELRKEFYENTSQRFHMYSMDQFIKLYTCEYEHSNSISAIEEVKKVETEMIRINNRKDVDLTKEILVSNIHYKQNSVRRKKEALNILLNKYANSNDPIPMDVKIQIDNAMRNLNIEMAQLDKMKKLFMYQNDGCSEDFLLSDLKLPKYKLP